MWESWWSSTNAAPSLCHSGWCHRCNVSSVQTLKGWRRIIDCSHPRMTGSLEVLLYSASDWKEWWMLSDAGERCDSRSRCQSPSSKCPLVLNVLGGKAISWWTFHVGSIYWEGRGPLFCGGSCRVSWSPPCGGTMSLVLDTIHVQLHRVLRREGGPHTLSSASGWVCLRGMQCL